MTFHPRHKWRGIHVMFFIKKDRAIADPARLEYLFVIQMFLVFVFYQVRLFFPYQISAQEYVQYI